AARRAPPGRARARRAPTRRGGLHQRRGRHPGAARPGDGGTHRCGRRRDRGRDRRLAGRGRHAGRDACREPRMKLITAIVRPEKLSEVLEALFKAEVRGLTISRAQGHGGETEEVETYRGSTVKMELVEKVRLDIGVSDPFVQVTIDAILESARTGEVGDGKIFVLPVEKVIRIRTGEEDLGAVTPAVTAEGTRGA